MEDEPDSAADALERAEQGRHASTLELFLDLAFVFAIAQITGVIGRDLSWAGLGRALLLAWLVWWLWSQFAWLGTAVDLGARSMERYLVLLAVPPTLLMAVALPDAYGASGPEFAGAYLVVNLWSQAILGRGLWGQPEARSAWLRYIPLAVLAPLVLLAGSLLDGDARVAVWLAVAVIDIASALAGGGGDESNDWKIDPTHFAERHALFVIISLGEVVVAIGGAASGVELTPKVGAALLTTSTVTCMLWWAYFAYVPDVVERELAMTRARDRGRAARDLFTFGHFPIVFGLVLYAVVAKHVVPHPTDHLHTADLWLLAGSVAWFVGGLAALQWRTVHRLSRERTGVIVLVAAICGLAGPHLVGVVVVALVGCVVAAQQAYTYRSYLRAIDTT